MMNPHSLSDTMAHGLRVAAAVLARSGLMIGSIAALLFAFPPNLHAQSSPLTLQPSTGNVGIGTTTPAYPLSVYRGGSGTTSNIESGFNGAVAQSRFAGLTAGAVSRVWGSGLNITNGNGGYEIYDYTAGASRFYINTGGNVGIGTITPVYALSVYRGGSGTTSNIESGVNGAVAQSRFAGFTGGAVSRVWGSGLNITNGNGGYEIYDYTAGASRFYINTGGNVGIGTTTPSTTLSVAGDLRTNNGAFPANGGSDFVITNSWGGVRHIALISNWYWGGAPADIRRSYTGGASAISFDATTDATAGDITFRTAPSGPADSAFTWTEAMKIKQNGNVGIGTTTPTKQLHVQSESASIRVRRASDDYWTDYGFGNLTTNGHFTISNMSGDIRLLPTGNVGIGTTAPTSLLHVNGTFTATSKNFQIDHPLEPDTKQLVHSALEGPEVAVYYRGEAQLENGQVSIALPSYFESLTRKENRTVQLTPIDGWAPLYIVGGVKDGKITVRTGSGGDLSQRFYWEVKAVRADVALLVVEKTKDVEDQRVAENRRVNP